MLPISFLPNDSKLLGDSGRWWRHPHCRGRSGLGSPRGGSGLVSELEGLALPGRGAVDAGPADHTDGLFVGTTAALKIVLRILAAVSADIKHEIFMGLHRRCPRYRLRISAVGL